MTKYLAIMPALVGALLLAGAATAETQMSDDDAMTYCGLNANQISRGFYCTVEESTDYYSRLSGPEHNRKCNDRVVTSTTYRSYNHRGNLQDAEDRVEEGDVEDANTGGGAYDFGSGCKHPVG